MTLEDIVNSEEVKSAVNDYRSMCFWSVAPDFFPVNLSQLQFVLDSLDRYGDLSAYRRSGRIREWLSHATSQRF